MTILRKAALAAGILVGSVGVAEAGVCWKGNHQEPTRIWSNNDIYAKASSFLGGTIFDRSSAKRDFACCVVSSRRGAKFFAGSQYRGPRYTATQCPRIIQRLAR